MNWALYENTAFYKIGQKANNLKKQFIFLFMRT